MNVTFRIPRRLAPEVTVTVEGCVQVYSPKGEHIQSIYTELISPFALSVSPEGSLMVASNNYKRLGRGMWQLLVQTQSIRIYCLK